jgi:hypothetical protein
MTGKEADNAAPDDANRSFQNMQNRILRCKVGTSSEKQPQAQLKKSKNTFILGI